MAKRHAQGAHSSDLRRNGDVAHSSQSGRSGNRTDPDQVRAAQSMDDLAHEHLDAVFRVLRRLTRDPDLAEELTQETFAAAQGNFSQYDQTRPALPWLLGIGVNIARQHRRRFERRRGLLERWFGRQEESVSTGPDDIRPGESQDDPFGSSAEETYGREEQREYLANRLAAQVNNLPLTLREAVLLRFYEELDLAAVAQALGISQEAAKKRVQRGLARLRDDWPKDL